MKTLITNIKAFINGNFIDTKILIDNDKIIEVSPAITADSETKTFDGQNAYVSYGFIDPHVHFRTPGAEIKEDWKSGSSAALAGGFTYVLDMPNNTPVAVDFNVLQKKHEIAEKDSLVNFGFYLGLTETNCDNLDKILKQCKEANIPIYGIKVFLGASTGLLLVENIEAVEKTFATGLPVLFHAEENSLLKNAPFTTLAQHEANRPAEAETEAIRKIRKAAAKYKNTAKIYICHLSSQSGLNEAVKMREDGFNIYLEATPHHLVLDLESIESSSFAKINPPIRHQKDVTALQNALKDKLIDCIGTDHAPHLLEEKLSDNPPSGFPGLETAFFALNKLVSKNIITLEMLVEKLTAAYKIFNIDSHGEIKVGNYANLVFLQHAPCIFKAEAAKTKAKFSAFDNITSDISIEHVFVNGQQMF